MISKNHTIILLVTLLLVSAIGCVDNNECDGRYFFIIPLNIEPNESVFQIGDTLDIVIRTDNRALRDTYTTVREVEFPSFDPFVSFLMPSLDDTITYSDGFKNHEILIGPETEIHQTDSGIISGVDIINVLTFPTGPEESLITFRIVLRKPGTYALYTVSLLGIIDRIEFVDFPERCGNRRTSWLQARFDIENENSEILTDLNKSSEDIFWTDFQAQRNQSAPFYLRVE